MRLKVTFAVLNLCSTRNSGNIACFNYSVSTHNYINWNARTVCDLHFIVKGEGLLKVTGSHVHWKSGNSSENGSRQRCCNKSPLTGSDTRIQLSNSSNYTYIYIYIVLLNKIAAQVYDPECP